MDAEGFDRLTRSLVSASRRGMLRMLAGLATGALGPGLAAAQSTCKPVGRSCTSGSQCCSGLCPAGSCVCKRLGQRCVASRNCCADATGGQTCQGGKCCRKPGFGCTGNTECCSGLCCNGFCCAANQVCEAGAGGADECACDVVAGYDPCGLQCCSVQQMCRNNTTCCTLNSKACSRHAQCCSGICRDGRCKPQTCQFHGDCRGYPGEHCCQGKCVLCPAGGTCIDNVCGCTGYWCPAGSIHPQGQCCGGLRPDQKACCWVGGSNDGACYYADATQGCPPNTVPAKRGPEQ